MTEEQISLLVDALVKLLIAIIPILAAIATRALTQYLEVKKKELKHQGRHKELLFLQTATKIAVLAAEQIFADDQQEQKLAYVAKRISEEARDQGIPIGHTQLRLLIEGTLKEIKLATNN